MKYYILSYIENAYNISKTGLKYRINRGLLKAEKYISAINYCGGKKYIYLIPETELKSLEHLKIHEPEFRLYFQPDEIRRRVIKGIKQNAGRWAEAPESYKESVRSYAPLQAAYYDYLQTPEYKRLKMECFKRDKFQCCICGSAKNLQAHHISYEHLKKPGELDDLITVCKTCHKEIHAHDLN